MAQRPSLGALLCVAAVCVLLWPGGAEAKHTRHHSHVKAHASHLRHHSRHHRVKVESSRNDFVPQDDDAIAELQVDEEFDGTNGSDDDNDNDDAGGGFVVRKAGKGKIQGEIDISFGSLTDAESGKGAKVNAHYAKDSDSAFRDAALKAVQALVAKKQIVPLVKKMETQEAGKGAKADSAASLDEKKDDSESDDEDDSSEDDGSDDDAESSDDPDSPDGSDQDADSDPDGGSDEPSMTNGVRVSKVQPPTNGELGYSMSMEGDQLEELSGAVLKKMMRAAHKHHKETRGRKHKAHKDLDFQDASVLDTVNQLEDPAAHVSDDVNAVNAKLKQVAADYWKA